MKRRQTHSQVLLTLCHGDVSEQWQHIRDQIQDAERDQNCIRRSIFLALVLTLFALSIVGYSAVFSPYFFQDWSHWAVRLSWYLGSGSLFCFLSFTAYCVWRRLVINRLYAKALGVIGNNLHRSPIIH